MTSVPFGTSPYVVAPSSTSTPAPAVLPEYRIVGDYWSFAVSFLNLRDGTPAQMSGMTPKAEFLSAYSQQPIPLLVLPPVSSDPANLIRFAIDTDSTHSGGVTIVPQSQAAATYPLRLHAYLIDSLGHDTTYSITPVVACDPRKVDLSLLPAPATIIAAAGPAGPQGVPGIRADQARIDAAISAAIQGQIPLLKGDKGDTGAAGPVGQQGPQGVQGPQGLQGPLGPQGQKGDQGVSGPKGDQGIAGSAGVDGRSAYQLAVDNGFSGTQPQWLASLVGAPGAAGQQGSSGPAGTQGPQGQTGAAGTKGDNGAQGPQGVPGATGMAGAQGPSGPVGLLFGTGTPSTNIGQNGQGYIDLASLAVWAKQSGAWSQIGYLSQTASGGTGVVGGTLDFTKPNSSALIAALAA